MEATETFWNNLAERYAQKPVPNLDAYQAKLRATRQRLSPGDTVLDIGCGTGSLALELAPHVAHVHSVDLSSEMLRIAADKAAKAGVDNVTFHNTAIEDLSAFQRERFDAVCAFNILHLVDAPRATLARIHSLLKPGGHFITTTPCLGSTWVPYGPVIAVMRWLGKAPRVHSFSVEQFLQDVRDAGFVEVKRQIVTKDKTNAFLLANKPLNP